MQKGAEGPPMGVPVGVPVYPQQPMTGYAEIQQQAGGHYGAPQQAYSGPQQTAAVVGVPLYPDQAPTQGRFVVQGYKDVWAAVLFYMQLIATIAVGIRAAVVDGVDWDNSWSPADAPDDGPREIANLWLWASVACAISAGTGLLGLVAMRACAYKFILISNVVMAIYMLSMAIWLLARGGGFGAVIFFLFALVNLAWLYIVRRRMHFAGVMLESATSVIFRWKGTICGSIVSLVLLVGYLLLFMVAVKAWVPNRKERQDGTTTTEGGQPGLLLLFILFLFWTANTIAGVTHTMVSGTVATWYFLQDCMPSNPTCASLKRSMTTSFGSVCFGSLVVAIIQTMRVIAQSMRGENNEFVQCCIECILRCLEDLIRYFNKYAFTQVAIYGKGYIEAAKATWDLIKSGAGLEALINDCLIDPALAIVTIIGALNTGLVCGLAAGDVATGVVCGVIGLIVLSTIMKVVDSAVATIFVCYAESPHTLARVNPALHTAIDETSRQW